MIIYEAMRKFSTGWIYISWTCAGCVSRRQPWTPGQTQKHLRGVISFESGLEKVRFAANRLDCFCVYQHLRAAEAVSFNATSKGRYNYIAFTRGNGRHFVERDEKESKTRELELKRKTARYNAKKRKIVWAVIRPCRLVICDRAGLLIVTKTPPQFYTRVHDCVAPPFMRRL